ncbi:hypothetical protein [Dactylosporangium sp. NPDC048998]|uniref:hypothetical protein n=1 Tax=Dactylosporangium sp. NPDC048998 TaxID=3363976 RepID=UPI00371ECA2C
MPDVAELEALIRRLTEAARPMVAGGASPDQVARHLLLRGGPPIAVIKAVADATGTELADAKWIVHRNLDPAVRAAAEDLWDDLLNAIHDSPKALIDPDSSP